MPTLVNPKRVWNSPEFRYNLYYWLGIQSYGMNERNTISMETSEYINVFRSHMFFSSFPDPFVSIDAVGNRRRSNHHQQNWYHGTGNEKKKTGLCVPCARNYVVIQHWWWERTSDISDLVVSVRVYLRRMPEVGTTTVCFRGAGGRRQPRKSNNSQGNFPNGYFQYVANGAIAITTSAHDPW